mgnify:FL=1
MITFEKYLQEFGLKIHNYRKRMGISQEKLAEMADMEIPYLSNIETGKANITLKTLYKIATALDVDLYKFFMIDD